MLKKLLLSTILGFVSLHAQSNKMNTIETVGDYLSVGIPLTAWVSTLAIGDTEGQLDFYKSFGATFLTTQALKYTINEERPNGGDLSFPSGHSSSAFQGAAFIHFRYGLKYAAVAYAAAAYVGYSRVVTDHHYTHDVIAGALIGVGFSWLFTKPYEVKKVKIAPVVYYSEENRQNVYALNLTF